MSLEVRHAHGLPWVGPMARLAANCELQDLSHGEIDARLGRSGGGSRGTLPRPPG